MKKKIPVSGPQIPMQNPFASLTQEAFPDVPLAEHGRSAASPDEPSKSIPQARPPRIVLRREKARRGGKSVVIASQLPTHLSRSELEVLCKKARKSLGCGGCLEGREIVLQGDNADRVRTFFEREGFAPVGPG